MKALVDQSPDKLKQVIFQNRKMVSSWRKSCHKATEYLLYGVKKKKDNPAITGDEKYRIQVVLCEGKDIFNYCLPHVS